MRSLPLLKGPLVRSVALALSVVWAGDAEAACESLLEAARNAAGAEIAPLAEAAACLNNEIAFRARSGASLGSDTDETVLNGEPGTTVLFSTAAAVLPADRMDAFGAWLARRGFYRGSSLWSDYGAFSAESPLAEPQPDDPLLSVETPGGPRVLLPVDPVTLTARPDLRRILDAARRPVRRLDPALIRRVQPELRIQPLPVQPQ